VVNVSSNRLETLQPELFARLVSMEELVLSGNLIAAVPSDLFKANTNLKTFYWDQVRLDNFFF
jgi:Leucine-rich repeat (LRR) protein